MTILAVSELPARDPWPATTSRRITATAARAPAWAGLLLSWLLAAPLPAAVPEPDQAQLRWLGEQIFRNECNSQLACLTAWNSGEEFPSLGLGHFIWYQEGQQAPYTETFPALLAFMATRGATLPAWLEAVGYEQPWATREAFLAASEDPRLVELRAFLAANMELQTAFIVSRFELALQALLAASPASEQALLRDRFEAVAQADAPHGLYALIDYVHFKGEGTRPQERYQGQGWGLLQVLQGMPAGSSTPLADFVASASAVLAQRVALAPPERNEQRWLNGWHRRVATYLPAAND